jgi:hypothetical protein
VVVALPDTLETAGVAPMRGRLHLSAALALSAVVVAAVAMKVTAAAVLASWDKARQAARAHP